MAIKPIQILINAKDNASGVFSSLQAKVATVGAAIASYFGVKAFAGVVQGAAEFEAGMSRVQAATGASAEEMAKLRKAAEDAGANTKYTSVEAADALTELGKAGLSATDAVGTLPAVLNLAQAGGVGLAEASEHMTGAIAGLGLSFADAGRVADVLALGANASKTSVNGLAQALSYAAPVAQSAGLSLEAVTAILGKMADGNIDATRSGTALSNILSQFSDPASQFKRALADAGITTNDFEEALKQLAAAGPKSEKALLAVGLNGGPGLRALINQGIPSLDALKQKLLGAEGSAATFAKVMEDNLGGSFKGLTSAWGALTIKLGTPVLPVLKDGVDQLAGAFRGLVADGTIGKFGDAIASAFQAGIKWVREFIGTVDFDEVALRLQAFADGAKERFDRLGQYATNAGATVKVAVGVVQTAFATLMVTAGGVANALTLMVQAGLTGLELLYRASEKITFGNVSAQYKAIADEFKLRSEAMGAASDAVSAQILEALNGIGAGMTNVQDGFSGIKTAIAGASTAATEGQAAQAALNKELSAGAEAAAAFGVAQQKKAVADQIAKQASDEHRAAIAQLRTEYDALIASENLTEAGKKLGEINQKLRETVPVAKDAAKAAADAAKAISDAFTNLGVVSSEALKTQADNAKRDYEIIKNAGTSSAEDIAAAFKAAADKAIAANKGVAPSWVEAQAATRGYKIETDAAGKSTLTLADAIDKAGASHHRTAGAIGEHMTALEKLNAAREREIAAQEKANQLTERALDLYRKKWNIDKEGFTLDANGQRMQQSAPNANYIYDTAKAQGLTEEQALALMDRYFKNGKGVGTSNGSDWFSTVNKAIADAVIESARKRAAAGPATNKNAQPADAATHGAPAPSGQTSSMGRESGSSGGSTGVAVTRVIELKLDSGRSFGVPTNGQGEAALNGFIQALASAKNTAAMGRS